MKRAQLEDAQHIDVHVSPKSYLGSTSTVPLNYKVASALRPAVGLHVPCSQVLLHDDPGVSFSFLKASVRWEVVFQ